MLGEIDDWHLTEALHHEHGQGDPFAAAVRATRMAMIITDPRLPDNPIVFCNEAFQKLTGYERHEIVGQNCRFLQGPETDRRMVARLREAVRQGENINLDLLNYRKDGSTFWNALYVSPVRGTDGEVKFFFASQLDVTERVEAQAEVIKQKSIVDREVKRRTAELEQALEAKTLLLHEVDHRVKNNLMMIGSLLRLQSRQIGNNVLAGKLEEMLQRVDALAVVHRQLYRSSDLTQFDLAEFAAILAADLIGASGRDDIELMMELVPVEIQARHASALGLVINEIITNAIKHGFSEGRSGAISLTSSRTAERAVITIEDDGHGIVLESFGRGLGRSLIVKLAKQAGGNVTWERLNHGTRVRLSLAS